MLEFTFNQVRAKLTNTLVRLSREELEGMLKEYGLTVSPEESKRAMAMRLSYQLLPR